VPYSRAQNANVPTARASLADQKTCTDQAQAVLVEHIRKAKDLGLHPSLYVRSRFDPVANVCYAAVWGIEYDGPYTTKSEDAPYGQKDVVAILDAFEGRLIASIVIHTANGRIDICQVEGTPCLLDIPVVRKNCFSNATSGCEANS